MGGRRLSDRHFLVPLLLSALPIVEKTSTSRSGSGLGGPRLHHLPSFALIIMASSSSSKPPSYLVPYTTLQPTYSEVHADVLSGSVTAEDVFLSFYADNAPQKSIHATLRLMQGPEEAPVDLEVVKGGVGLVAIEEVGAEQPRDLSVTTKAHAAAKHPPTSPIHLQNGPVLDQGVRLRLPRITRSRLLQGTRSQTALDRGAGGTISAFDVAAGESEGSYRFVVAGEEGECRVGGFAMATSSSGSGSAGDAAMESVEERAQRRMAEKMASQGAKPVDVKGHVGDVQKARFFPSGKGERARREVDERLQR